MNVLEIIKVVYVFYAKRASGEGLFESLVTTDL